VRAQNFQIGTVRVLIYLETVREQNGGYLRAQMPFQIDPPTPARPSRVA
jgi:hypothetical protein